MATVLLLCVSNVFMTFAWYGHLKYGHDWPLWKAVLVSWVIALAEYCLAWCRARPVGVWAILRVSAQGRAGSRDALRVHGVCGRVPQRAVGVELSRGVRADCRRGVFRIWSEERGVITLARGGQTVSLSPDTSLVTKRNVDFQTVAGD